MNAVVERKSVQRNTLTLYFHKLIRSLFFLIFLETVKLFGNDWQVFSNNYFFSQQTAQMKEDVFAMNSEAEKHKSAIGKILKDIPVLHGNISTIILKQKCYMI